MDHARYSPRLVVEPKGWKAFRRPNAADIELHVLTILQTDLSMGQ